MANKIVEKKLILLDLIRRCADEPESCEKSTKMDKLLNDYYLYCYLNNLNPMYEQLIHLISKAYILPSEPNITDISSNEIVPIVDIIKANKMQGVSEKEAELLLKFVVQKAREIINRECDIMTSSLVGECGFGQALTMVPLKKIGLEVTINNVSSFPNCYNAHAFGTVIIPVISENGVQNERYLVDVTYRQFFSSVAACHGKYYMANKGKLNKHAPLHGYHMLRYQGGPYIANKLLKDGFIRLTPEILKAYGVCFALQSLPYSMLDKKASLMDVDVSEYMKCLDKQFAFAFDSYDLMEIEYFTLLPSSEIKR